MYTDFVLDQSGMLFNLLQSSHKHKASAHHFGSTELIYATHELGLIDVWKTQLSLKIEGLVSHPGKCLPNLKEKKKLKTQDFQRVSAKNCG